MQSKDKVVNFRVTHQEYISYCQACYVAGMNNLSEMARVAMREFVGQKIAAAEETNKKSPDVSSVVEG